MRGKPFLIISVVTLAMVLALMVASAASASTKGRRNTALALTAGAIYSAMRGNDEAAIALGVGSALAWQQHNESSRRDRYWDGRRGRRGYSYYPRRTYGNDRGYYLRYDDRDSYYRRDRGRRHHREYRDWGRDRYRDYPRYCR